MVTTMYANKPNIITNAKYQVSGVVRMPNEVAEILGLKPGDKVNFELTAEGEVIIWRNGDEH